MNVEDEMAVREDVTIRQWIHYCAIHLPAAALHARNAYKIESTAAPGDQQALATRRTHVIAAIFAAVACVEATANELYLDALDNPTDMLTKDFNPALVGLLAQHAQRVVSSGPILPKFQIALDLAGVPRLRETSSPYAAMNALRFLRNRLVHHEPRWFVSYSTDTNQSPTDDTRLQPLLANRFRLNSLGFTEVFPNSYLSHDCAAWAVRTSRGFVRAFYRQLGLDSPLDTLEGLRTR